MGVTADFADGADSKGDGCQDVRNHSPHWRMREPSLVSPYPRHPRNPRFPFPDVGSVTGGRSNATRDQASHGIRHHTGSGITRDQASHGIRRHTASSATRHRAPHGIERHTGSSATNDRGATRDRGAPPEPEGFTAISRGLSEERAIPPGSQKKRVDPGRGRSPVNPGTSGHSRCQLCPASRSVLHGRSSSGGVALAGQCTA